MLSHVTWPYQYDPRRSAIYALNDVDVKAPPEVVWKLLVDAQNWSSYFPAEDQVKILTGEPELALGTKYSRVTVGFLMKLIVTEYVPAAGLVVDGGRRRRDRFERLPRLGHHSHGQWLSCAIRGDAARPLLPRGDRAQASRCALQLSPGMGRKPCARSRGGSPQGVGLTSMLNKIVLRGGSGFTAPGLSRATYRTLHFHRRWQGAGARLAKDAPVAGDDVAGSAPTCWRVCRALTRRCRANGCTMGGSALFEEICELPEYYPIRTELTILEQAAPSFAATIPVGAVLVEFGSGSSRKTRLLLDAARQLAPTRRSISRRTP